MTDEELFDAWIAVDNLETFEEYSERIRQIEASNILYAEHVRRGVGAQQQAMSQAAMSQLHGAQLSNTTPTGGLGQALNPIISAIFDKTIF